MQWQLECGQDPELRQLLRTRSDVSRRPSSANPRMSRVSFGRASFGGRSRRSSQRSIPGFLQQRQSQAQPEGFDERDELSINESAPCSSSADAEPDDNDRSYLREAWGATAATTKSATEPGTEQALPMRDWRRPGKWMLVDKDHADSSIN